MHRLRFGACRCLCAAWAIDHPQASKSPLRHLVDRRFRRLTWPFDERSSSSAGVYALGHVPSRHSDTTGMSRAPLHRCLGTSLIFGACGSLPRLVPRVTSRMHFGPGRAPRDRLVPTRHYRRLITDDGRTWLARDDEGPHGPTGRRPRGDGKHHRGPTHRGRVVAPDVHRSPPKACAYVASRPSDTTSLGCLITSGTGRLSVCPCDALGFSGDKNADRLRLTACTGEDHLKAVFDKTGSGSRGEGGGRAVAATPADVRHESRLG